jgi:hypothetical protein
VCLKAILPLWFYITNPSPHLATPTQVTNGTADTRHIHWHAERKTNKPHNQFSISGSPEGAQSPAPQMCSNILIRPITVMFLLFLFNRLPTATVQLHHSIFIWQLTQFMLLFLTAKWPLTNRSHLSSLRWFFFPLWLYIPLDFGRSFSFLILFTFGKTPWTGDEPVARPLPTYRTTQTQNKSIHRHPCLEWDSNPRSQCSRGQRQFMLKNMLRKFEENFYLRLSFNNISLSHSFKKQHESNSSLGCNRFKFPC